MSAAAAIISEEMARPVNPFLYGVGQRIRKAREDRSLSQEELGALSGVSQGQISNYELGVSNMKIDTLRLIALAVAVDACDLLGGKRR